MAEAFTFELKRIKPLSQILGREDLKQSLQQILMQSPESVFILRGAKGSGKKYIARSLAQSLLCEAPFQNGDACGVCSACRCFQAGSHLDYETYFSEAEGKQIAVKTLRDGLCLSAMKKPRQGRRKVFLLEASSLSEAGQNVLLKTLEDSPINASYILLLDTEIDLLPTLFSRAKSFWVPSLDKATLKAILQDYLRDLKLEDSVRYEDYSQKLQQNPNQISLSLSMAMGSVGAFLKFLFESSEVLEALDAFRSSFESWLRLPSSVFINAVWLFFEAFKNDKEAISNHLFFMEVFFRDLTVLLQVDTQASLLEKDKQLLLYPVFLESYSSWLKLKPYKAENFLEAERYLQDLRNHLERNGNYELQISRFALCLSRALLIQ